MYLQKWVYLTVTFAMLVLFSLTVELAGASGDKAVAEVNGTEIMQVELIEALNKIYPITSFHGETNQERRNKYIPEAMETVINDELIYQEAIRRGYKVDAKKIKGIRKEIIAKLGSKKKYKQALRKRNLSDRKYKKLLEKRYIIDTFIEKEIIQKSMHTDEFVAEHYERNKEKYLKPESRRLWHVLIKVEPNAVDETRQKKLQRAEEVMNLAREGKDLYGLAWDYSDGPFRVKGGDIGNVHKGSIEPELDKVAFELSEGEISGVIKTIYGYHVIKMIKVYPPTQLSLEDVGQKVKRELNEQKETQLRESLLSELRDKATIKEYQ